MKSHRTDPFMWSLSLNCFVLIAIAIPAEGLDAQVSEIDPTTEQTTGPFRLMSAAQDRQLRKYFPKVTDASIQRVLDDARLILYSEKEMPKCYQDWDGSLQGLHSAQYNISADGAEPFGNANLEFPWGRPAGTHRTSTVSAFRFLWLPLDEQGKPLPVVWHRKLYRGDNTRGYAWTFPVGAIVGEVLRQRATNGKLYTFELRVRERESGDWSVDVFRPFPTTRHLAERIKRLRPNWQKDETLDKLVSHLDDRLALTKMRLADDDHSRRTLVQSMGVDSLPTVGDDALVIELLTTTTFQSALGRTWRYGENDVWTCAPTTDAEFHIVPTSYDAGFIAVNRFSCMRCHDTVGIHARDFDFPRDWYGRVRGSDGIFSFHPFDLSSISQNGFGVQVKMRSELVEAGLVEQFVASKHPNAIYNKVTRIEN